MCRGCRFWRPSDPEDTSPTATGTCEAATEGYSSSDHGMVVIVYAERGVDAVWLETRADFSCAAWEEGPWTLNR